MPFKFLFSLLLACTVVTAQAARPKIVEKNGDLYQVTPGKTIRLTRHGGNFDYELSPNGRYLAFASYPNEVMQSPGGYGSDKWEGAGLYMFLQNIWLMDLSGKKPVSWRVAAQPANFVYKPSGEYDHQIYRSALQWSADSSLVAWLEKDSQDHCRIGTYQPAARRVRVFPLKASCMDNGAQYNQLTTGVGNAVVEPDFYRLLIIRASGIQQLKYQPPGQKGEYVRTYEPDPKFTGDTLTMWVVNSLADRGEAPEQERAKYAKDRWKLVYNFKTGQAQYTRAAP